MFQKAQEVTIHLSANFTMKLRRRLPGSNEPRELIGRSLNFSVYKPKDSQMEGTILAVMKALSDQYGDMEFTVSASRPSGVTMHMISQDPKLVKSFLGPDDTYVYPASPEVLSRTGLNVLQTPKKAWEYLYPNAEQDPDMVIG